MGPGVFGELPDELRWGGVAVDQDVVHRFDHATRCAETAVCYCWYVSPVVSYHVNSM